MGVMIPRGGTLIAGLVGVACEAIAANQFEWQIPLLSEAELAHVAARLDRIAAKRTPFADIVQEEAYFHASATVEMLNDPKGYMNFDTLRDMLAENDPAAIGTGKKKALTLKQNWEAMRFLIADKNAIVQDNFAYHQALAAEARRPYAGPSRVKVPDNLLARMSGDIYSRIRDRFAAMETVQNILRTEVALQRYRKAHGRFPNALLDLAPAYLTSRGMSDPFSAGLLRYRCLQNGKAYLLYSIGPDQKDDASSPSQFVGTAPGDIVAFKMRPRRTFKK
jgi:hypothetical protein